MCDHFLAGCKENEWLCPDQGCIPLSAPCKKNRPSSGRDGCIQNYRGQNNHHVLCKATNMCQHKFTPCDGDCSSAYPRLNYCKATESCLNIAKSCAGVCLGGNRFKCFSEDRCIHRNKVNNGVFDCNDQSDEDIQSEVDIKRALYKLLTLNNITLSVG